MVDNYSPEFLLDREIRRLLTLEFEENIYSFEWITPYLHSRPCLSVILVTCDLGIINAIIKVLYTHDKKVEYWIVMPEDEEKLELRFFVEDGK